MLRKEISSYIKVLKRRTRSEQMANNDEIVANIFNTLSSNPEDIEEQVKTERIGAFGKVKSTKGKGSAEIRILFCFG